jgi:hypothetical protein
LSDAAFNQRGRTVYVFSLQATCRARGVLTNVDGRTDLPIWPDLDVPVKDGLVAHPALPRRTGTTA